MTTLEQLSDFREQLAQIPCLRTKWGDFEVWIATFRPFVRHHFADFLNDFERATTAPTFVKPVGILGSELSPKTIIENNSRVETVSKKLLGFVDTLRTLESRSDPKAEAPLTRLTHLLSRFNLVVRQLKKRRKAKPVPFSIDDEYDVQDLLHALLRIDFEDIQPEDPTPVHAGASAKRDFVLRKEKIVIEAKMTRDGLTDKKLGEELLVDIARYKGSSDCKTLVCFVYDAEHRLTNPAGIKHDLETHSKPQLAVVVCICQG